MPIRIIYFRNGVTEDQLRHTFEHEIDAIRMDLKLEKIAILQSSFLAMLMRKATHMSVIVCFMMTTTLHLIKSFHYALIYLSAVFVGGSHNYRWLQRPILHTKQH